MRKKEELERKGEKSRREERRLLKEQGAVLFGLVHLHSFFCFLFFCLNFLMKS